MDEILSDEDLRLFFARKRRDGLPQVKRNKDRAARAILFDQPRKLTLGERYGKKG